MSKRSATDKLWIGIDAWGRSGRKRRFAIEADWPEMEVKPCPICGRKPFVSGIANCKADDRFFTVKAHCEGWHTDCGDWKNSVMVALEDWNRRTEDDTQPDLYQPSNWDRIRRYTPAEFARFIAWLAPNFCHNQFRPIYHQEEHKNGTVSTCCDGKCTDCILRFLEAKDGIYSKFGEDKSRFEPDKDYHV